MLRFHGYLQQLYMQYTKICLMWTLSSDFLESPVVHMHFKLTPILWSFATEISSDEIGYRLAGSVTAHWLATQYVLPLFHHLFSRDIELGYIRAILLHMRAPVWSDLVSRASIVGQCNCWWLAQYQDPFVSLVGMFWSWISVKRGRNSHLIPSQRG